MHGTASLPVVGNQRISIVDAKTEEEMPCDVVLVGQKNVEDEGDLGTKFDQPARRRGTAPARSLLDRLRRRHDAGALAP